jgi:hypothetical protein
MSARENSQAVRANQSATGDREVAKQPWLPDARRETRDFGRASSNSRAHSVELHIEELVLHGFDPAHRYQIGDAVERELTRLFAEHGAPADFAEDVEFERLNGGSISLPPGVNPETAGIELARVIYGGLGR